MRKILLLKFAIIALLIITMSCDDDEVLEKSLENEEIMELIRQSVQNTLNAEIFICEGNMPFSEYAVQMNAIDQIFKETEFILGDYLEFSYVEKDTIYSIYPYRQNEKYLLPELYWSKYKSITGVGRLLSTMKKNDYSIFYSEKSIWESLDNKEFDLSYDSVWKAEIKLTADNKIETLILADGENLNFSYPDSLVISLPSEYHRDDFLQVIQYKVSVVVDGAEYNFYTSIFEEGLFSTSDVENYFKKNDYHLKLYYDSEFTQPVSDYHSSDDTFVTVNDVTVYAKWFGP